MAFEALKDFGRRIKRLFTSNFARSIPDVARVQSVASEKMLDDIDLWLNMYGGNAPWLKENDQSLGLAAIIASEVARLVTLEMEIEVSGSPMADYINEMLDMIRKNARTIVEYACAGGGLIIKPCVGNQKIHPEFIQANNFFPVAYNSSLKITSAYFVYRHWEGKKIYSRLEKHTLDGTKYTVTNEAYVSSVEQSLGKPCYLFEVSEWADIEPEVSMDDVEEPLFAYLKVPVGNTTDMSSPLGVSVYSRAVSLIRDADEQYQSLMWEYRGGELAIDAASDAFDNGSGIPSLPKGKERLFRMNELDAAKTSGGSKDLLKEWAPDLRDSNYMSGLNRILIQIEDACCLSRGTLSDAQETAKTATEIKIMKQRSYALISDLQTSFQNAIDDYIYAVYCLASLYDLAPDGKYTATYQWDDSVIVDAEAERLRDQQEVSQGLMQKWEYRVKWYGETEEQAKKALGDTMTDDEILGFGNEPPEDEKLKNSPDE